MRETLKPGDIKEILPDTTVTRQAEGKSKVTLLKTITAAEIDATEYPPIECVVEDLIPEGCSLICGRPKAGKSWILLELCLAVAKGLPFLGRRTTQGRALYLDLEESERIVKRRMRTINAVKPENLHFAFEAPQENPKSKESLIPFLDQWMEVYPDTKLICIDTLEKVRREDNRKINQYRKDYAALSPFKEFAESHNVSMLVSHHVNKSGSGSRGEEYDIADSVSGTNAILGAVDTGLWLDHKTGQKNGRLITNGRIIEGCEMRLTFENGLWRNADAEDSICDEYKSSPVVIACKQFHAECGEGRKVTYEDFRNFAASLNRCFVAKNPKDVSALLHDAEPGLAKYDGLRLEFYEKVPGTNGKRSGGFRIFRE